jgi:hypothetical protein
MGGFSMRKAWVGWRIGKSFPYLVRGEIRMNLEYFLGFGIRWIWD